MLTFLICVVAVTLTYCFFYLNLGFKMGKIKFNSTVINDHRVHFNTQEGDQMQQLLPLPGIKSKWRALPWMIFVCRGVVTRFLRHIGKQGKIIEIKLWKIRMVILNDFFLAKELFKNPIFCAKSKSQILTAYTQGPFGIINTSEEVWKSQRKFCQQHLKDFGFGTKAMEALIHQEIEDLIENWRGKKGQPFSPNKEFYISILSSIWMILTGERASAQDEQLVFLVNNVYEALREYLGFPEILLCTLKLKLKSINRIVKWIPIFPGVVAFVNSTGELHMYFKSIINCRRNNLDSKGIPSNFVDAYLKKVEGTMNPESEFYGEKGESHLLGAMMDFFIAGGDTTANMLAWAMLHLIRNPDIQDKIRYEIDTAIGTDRLPSLQDRLNCPFTEAFLWEVLRCEPVAAASLPHVPQSNTNIGPYFIEEGTLLFINLYNILYDPMIWTDPDNFRPERFLSKDGKTIVKNEAMCSFSLGLRRCVGEQSARDNLFLFVSAICQKFILKPDPRLKEPPKIDNNKSGLHTPKTFYMVAMDRFSNPDI